VTTHSAVVGCETTTAEPRPSRAKGGGQLEAARWRELQGGADLPECNASDALSGAVPDRGRVDPGDQIITSGTGRPRRPVTGESAAGP